MKQLFTIIISLCSLSLSAATIFVTSSGSAQSSGNNWSDATSLQHACSIANNGDQIWVAEGTYLAGKQKESSFVIKAGVKVFGGFSGTETSVEQRNPQASATILSGKINETDNVYTVVTMLDTDSETLLDGFTIQDGKAYLRDRNVIAATAGGALFVSAKENGQGPTINNCIFTNIQARHGGAVFVDGRTVAIQAIFSNCTFTNNKAKNRGGAIYNSGDNGSANSIIENCIFNNNNADRGACIFNNGTNGESNPLIVKSQFENNHAITDGAIVFSFSEEEEGNAQPIITDCTMNNNTHAFDGGKEIATNIINNSTFTPGQQGGKRNPIN